VQLATSLPLLIQDLALHISWHIATADWHEELSALYQRRDPKRSRGSDEVQEPTNRRQYKTYAVQMLENATRAATIMEGWLTNMSDTVLTPPTRGTRLIPVVLRGLTHNAQDSSPISPELTDFITHTWWTRAQHGVYARLTPTERRLMLEFVYVLSEQDRLVYWLGGYWSQLTWYPAVLSVFPDTVAPDGTGGRGGYGDMIMKRWNRGGLKGHAAEALRRLLRELSHRGQTWAGYSMQTHIASGPLHESVLEAVAVALGVHADEVREANISPPEPECYRDNRLMSDPELRLRAKRAEEGESADILIGRLDEENYHSAGLYSPTQRRDGAA
jgi:hypothetical protein